MSDYNVILDVDSYKSSHSNQYPPGTTSMFSYYESRGGKFDSTVFFGMQYYVKKYLTQRITKEMVDEAADFFAVHGEPFPKDGWMRIVNEFDGKLPVRIRAVKEGSVIKNHHPLFTIESTDPETFWVVSWLETMLVRVWHPINVATLSANIKKLILSYLEKTADTTDGIWFKLHDFGSRGVSSQESAAIGGAAHLINFMGSDTVVGVLTANKYYNTKMSAFSIPASEHSTITSWGRENEVDAYRNMLKQFAKPGSLVACVSDSYDLFSAIENLWGGTLKQEVINSGAILVVRPDSGHPATIVEEALKRLDEKFGHIINSKGFKVLNHVRVIQGDGVDYSSINEILQRVTKAGYSTDNVNFGCGGILLQIHNRDTQKFALKCSSITVNECERDVFKDPVTDSGKRSKKGRLDLIVNDLGEYETVKLSCGEISHKDSVMNIVFENGVSMNDTTLDEIRNRLWEK